MPFFCCYDKVLDNEMQEDISKYKYCTDTGTPAYSGAYGDMPKKWIDKFYIIRKALNLRDEILKEKASK